MLSGESIMSESQERSAALRERLERYAEVSYMEMRHSSNFADFLWHVFRVFQNRTRQPEGPSGNLVMLWRSDFDALREAAASLSPQPAPEWQEALMVLRAIRSDASAYQWHRAVDSIIARSESPLPRPAPAPQKGE
jgi:uncharacterized Zn finger protein